MTAEEMLWEYGGDILRSPTMDQERTIPQHGSTTCYDHSVAVTLCSIRLAQKWGWDVDWRSLVRGALLHDYFSTTGGNTIGITSSTGSTTPARPWRTPSGISV